MLGVGEPRQHKGDCEIAWSWTMEGLCPGCALPHDRGIFSGAQRPQCGVPCDDVQRRRATACPSMHPRLVVVSCRP